MSKRRHWQEKIWERQQNTLPSDVLRNDRLTNDALYSPSRPMPKVQRVGAVIVGAVYTLPALVVGAMLIHASAEIRQSSVLTVLAFLFMVPFCWLAMIGLRIMNNGLTGQPTTRARHERR